ncbi:MAG: hypothetical protein FDZ70_07340 [Actinobacteria bacterium]|nr:MAG: hypothetical protein FDZ70_07340 [Actinomycetota bacterium]
MSDLVIGAADEFYRLRIVRVDDADAPDLEWREDILYREPPAQDMDEYAVWRVEVVSVLDDELVTSLGEYPSEREAEERLGGAQEDLDRMTKSQFDAAYLGS